MAQSVRIEFVQLGEGGAPINIIRGLEADSITLAVTNTATAEVDRPEVPVGGSDRFGTPVRLTAKENSVFVAWNGDDATLTNSLELFVGIPEIIYIKDGGSLSFIAESA